MSWTLASLAIVCLILAAGWIAYERRRPSARMAAVVAVMAAMAALGRDAFAAAPDVKPITAMTLVVGYSLGPLPGFAVGALGMLVSNFMLGQGPYTPWQMAAWGMVGLFGAALGSLSRRSLGRIPLALACGLSALAAKEIMNFYQWTLGASHTSAALLAVVGQGLTYDLTDVIASVLFGLAFGPELARVLARTRVRMQITWAPAQAEPTARPSIEGVVTLVVLVVGASALLGAGHAPAASASAEPAAVEARLALGREVSYLAGAQNADGGFGASQGQSSSELYSAWAALGLAASGRDPLSLSREGHTVLNALRGEARSLRGAGDLERTILALRACGVSVHSLPGGDPVKRLLRERAHDGSIGHLSNLTAFEVLALRAAGYGKNSATIRSATTWLVRQQDPDGGFGFATRGGGSDVDDTAAVLQALGSAGLRGRVLNRGVSFLVHAQNPDGGYPQELGGASNAQSTAWAVQGLIAAGRDVQGVRRNGSRTPAEYLESLIGADGSLRYSRTGEQTPVWVTAQALTALAGRPFPIAVPARPRSASAGELQQATRAVGRLAGLVLSPMLW
jgi:energy-coupling factor transport system substrate-specific component